MQAATNAALLATPVLTRPVIDIILGIPRLSRDEKGGNQYCTVYIIPDDQTCQSKSMAQGTV